MAFCCLKTNTNEGPSKKAKNNTIRRSGNDLLMNRDMDTSLLNGMNSLAFSDLQINPSESTNNTHYNLNSKSP